LPKSPPTFRPHGLTKPAQQQAYDRERGSASQRLYGSRWATVSKSFLRAHPLCRYCELEGMVTVATLVDHFWPHRGDQALFWRSEFWIGACASCHSGMKQSVERQGHSALLALAQRLGIRGEGG
jgi:5-methylcytosine-specific restriction protein A